MKKSKRFIRNSLLIGWIVLITGLLMDMFVPNKVDWFPRAAAMLCLLSLIAEFRLQQLDSIAFREDWRKRISDEKYFDDPLYEPDSFWTGMKMFSHISMAVGTVFWAVGDLLV